MNGNFYKEKSVIAKIKNLGAYSLAEFLQATGKTKDDFAFTTPENGKRVALVGGGMSAEREVSFMSCNGIARSLIELGHDVTFVDMGGDIAEVLSKLKPDVVFNGLHGTYGEDGCLPGLLNIMRIPYTGSGVMASSVAFNKKESMKLFAANNIKIPEGKIVTKADNLKSDPLPRPYVIKPIAQGSSVGVIIVMPEDDFAFADYDFPYGDEILVDKYVKGREMQVAVLNGRAIGVLEIKLLKGKRFYDYETKYTDGFAQHLVPAPVPENIYRKIMQLAEKACRLFEVKGMVRAEMIYSEQDNELYMLEINTHPGMTPLSICPEIAAIENMSYTDLVKAILAAASFE